MLFSNVFYKYKVFMKNPFLNTNDYAIVKQFKRITQRKRSVSNSSSDTSSLYSHSPIFSSTGTSYFNSKRNRICSVSKLDEYQVKKKQEHLYIQNLRAKVYGVEQFRYRPSYYDEFMKQQYYPTCNQSHQKSSKKSTYKNLTNQDDNYYSIKQASYKSNSSQKNFAQPKQQEVRMSIKCLQKQQSHFVIDEDFIKEQQKVQPQYDRKTLKNLKSLKFSEDKQNVSARYSKNSDHRSSKQQEMISSYICNKEQAKDGNYASITQFPSRINLKQTPKLKRGSKKKCSLFQAIMRQHLQDNQQESQNQNYNIKRKASKKQYQDQVRQTEKSLKSILKIPQSKNQAQNGNSRFSYNQQQGVPLVPPLINVRGKIFYLNQSGKHRASQQQY